MSTLDKLPGTNAHYWANARNPSIYPGGKWFNGKLPDGRNIGEALRAYQQRKDVTQYGGHRGFRGLDPVTLKFRIENTKEAYAAAFEVTRRVEGDTNRDVEGQGFMHHDMNVYRLLGEDIETKDVAIRDLPTGVPDGRYSRPITREGKTVTRLLTDCSITTIAEQVAVVGGDPNRNFLYDCRNDHSIRDVAEMSHIPQAYGENHIIQILNFVGVDGPAFAAAVEAAGAHPNWQKLHFALSFNRDGLAKVPGAAEEEDVKELVRLNWEWAESMGKVLPNLKEHTFGMIRAYRFYNPETRKIDYEGVDPESEIAKPGPFAKDWAVKQLLEMARASPNIDVLTMFQASYPVKEPSGKMYHNSIVTGKMSEWSINNPMHRLALEASLPGFMDDENPDWVITDRVRDCYFNALTGGKYQNLFDMSEEGLDVPEFNQPKIF